AHCLSRDPVEQVYNQIRKGMSDAELHRITNFDRFFQFESSYFADYRWYRAVRENDHQFQWICTIEMSRDGVVTKKDWHHFYDDTNLGRIISDLFNRFEWREGHHHSNGQPGQTFAF